MYPFFNGKFKEAHVWWDTKPNYDSDVDIFFFIHDFEGRAEYKYGFRSLHINLNDSNETIFNDFKPNLRNELRSAANIDFKFKITTNPTEEEMHKFVDEFNAFAEYKKIGKTSFDYLSMLSKEGKLALSFIEYNGETLFGHSHYFTKDMTRLLHSYSNPTNIDSKIANLANKALTQKDIFDFKDFGLKTYDFGGIGNVEGDNKQFEGIIKFKKSFGGHEVILWKGVTPNGEKGIEVIKKYFPHIKLK